jgi:hypothetical protein
MEWGMVIFVFLIKTELRVLWAMPIGIAMHNCIIFSILLRKCMTEQTKLFGPVISEFQLRHNELLSGAITFFCLHQDFLQVLSINKFLHSFNSLCLKEARCCIAEKRFSNATMTFIKISGNTHNLFPDQLGQLRSVIGYWAWEISCVQLSIFSISTKWH